jgi:hypothetical protein
MPLILCFDCTAARAKRYALYAFCCEKGAEVTNNVKDDISWQM